MKRVKFPLKMANDAMVRNLEELKESFNIKKVVEYFLDGKLHTWLEDRYYDKEFEAISKLDESDIELSSKLCAIFGVEDSEVSNIDTREIKDEQEKIAKLRQITDDDNLIDKTEFMVFNQEELEKLYEKNETDTIYLCGGRFDIPTDKRNKRYIMVGKPIVIGLKFDVALEKGKLYIDRGNGKELVDDRVSIFTHDERHVFYFRFEETKKHAIKRYDIVFSKTETIFVDEKEEIRWCDYESIRMKCHNNYLIWNTYTRLYAYDTDSGEFKMITNNYISKYDYQISENKLYFISTERKTGDGNVTKWGRYKDGQIISIDIRTSKEEEVARHKDAFYIYNGNLYTNTYVGIPFGGTEINCEYLEPGNHFYVSDLDGKNERELKCVLIKGCLGFYKNEIGCAVKKIEVKKNIMYYEYRDSNDQTHIDSFEI